MSRVPMSFGTGKPRTRKTERAGVSWCVLVSPLSASSAPWIRVRVCRNLMTCWYTNSGDRHEGNDYGRRAACRRVV